MINMTTRNTDITARTIVLEAELTEMKAEMATFRTDLTSLTTSLSKKLEARLSEVHSMLFTCLRQTPQDQGSIPNAGSNSLRVEPIVSPGLKLNPMALHLPEFNGKDPIGWIVCVNRHFHLREVEDSQRLDAVLVAMQGSIVLWYQWIWD